MTPVIPAGKRKQRRDHPADRRDRHAGHCRELYGTTRRDAKHPLGNTHRLIV